MLNDTIFVTLAGSHAHGTSGPRSDIDLRGVCIAPLSDRLSLSQRFEQFEGALKGPLWNAVVPRLQAHETARQGLAGKVEAVIYELAKFLELCARANPNALETLFADPRDWLYVDERWRRIWNERHRFLTRKIEATYLGYGLGQLKKIRLHRGWLLDPPKAPPAREDFGLPGSSMLGREDHERIERAVAEKLRSYGIDDFELPKHTRILLAERMRRFMADALSCPDDTLDAELRSMATPSLQLPGDVVRALDAEREYRAAQKHWESSRGWQRLRSPTRAELERRYGYDTKHAAHLLRLLQTGLEVIQTGELRVRRENADELVAVINGALRFEQLVERAAQLQEQMAEAMRHCTLRDDVDYAFVDELLMSLVAPDVATRRTRKTAPQE